jgi:uncharacterized protein
MAANRELADSLPVVIDYLERNPDFFLDNPTLLSNINLPHITGRNVSSLIEYQVDKLRKNEVTLKTQIESLIKNQEHCDRLAQEAYKLSFELAETESIAACYDKLFHFLKFEYQCSHLLIFFFVTKRPHDDYRNLRFKPIHSKLRYLFSGLYNVNKPLCDSLPYEYIDAMFGDESHKIKSTVSLPINNEEPLGLFILGSENYNAYKQGFSINLLNHLKNVFVTQCSKILRQ